MLQRDMMQRDMMQRDTMQCDMMQRDMLNATYIPQLAKFFDNILKHHIIHTAT